METYPRLYMHMVSFIYLLLPQDMIWFVYSQEQHQDRVAAKHRVLGQTVAGKNSPRTLSVSMVIPYPSSSGPI